MSAATLRDGCPACEDGYICRHGDGCIVDEAFGPTDSQKRRDAAAARKRHVGISLWRDLYEPSHLIVVFFGRRYLHLYGFGRPYPRRVYWIKVPNYRTHLNDEDFPEFRRLPV